MRRMRLATHVGDITMSRVEKIKHLPHTLHINTPGFSLRTYSYWTQLFLLHVSGNCVLEFVSHSTFVTFKQSSSLTLVTYSVTSGTLFTSSVTIVSVGTFWFLDFSNTLCLLSSSLLWEEVFSSFSKTLSQ